MDLQQLTYFVAVAEERSFTRAAAREHVVQSTVSAAISRLEDELGVALLRRAPGGTDPTGAGLVLVERARRMIADARAVREELTALKGTVEGIVTIGGPVSTGTLDMPAVFHAMRRRSPLVDVRVRIVEAAHEGTLAPLQDGRCDLLLLPEPAQVPPGFQVVPIARLDLALVTTSDRASEDGRWTAVEAAAAATIDFPVGWPIRQRTDAYFAAQGAARKVAIEVTDVAAILTLIRAGLGAAFLPAALVHEWAGVAPVGLVHPVPARTLVLATPTRPLRPAVQALAQLVLEQATAG